MNTYNEAKAIESIEKAIKDLEKAIKEIKWSMYTAAGYNLQGAQSKLDEVINTFPK